MADQYRIYDSEGKTFRCGVRNDGWVVDTTLTPTGFSGTQDVDWEQLTEYKRQ